MKTFIIQTPDALWWLVFSQNGRWLTVMPHNRLVEAMDTANTLQVHIDNVSSLPISQYLDQSKSENVSELKIAV